MQPSPWLSEPARAYPALDRDLRVDVVVVGAGITGVTAAYTLKARGFSVALLDRARVGHGDTGHTTAHLAAVTDRPPHDLLAAFGAETAAAVWEAGRTAIAAIERAATDLEVDCGFARVPGYLHARPGHERAGEDAAALREGLATTEELRLGASWRDAVPGFGVPGIHYADQARFRPQPYLHALAAAVDGAGSVVHEHTAVEEISGAPFQVRAGGHTIEAGRVVLATHTPRKARPAQSARCCRRCASQCIRATPCARGSTRAACPTPCGGIRWTRIVTCAWIRATGTTT